MACGDRYPHLLRATGGRTIREPFSSWCNEVDAQAWYGQATTVHKLQVAAWNALMAVENERGAYPETDKLRASAEAYDRAFATLPEPSMWMAFGYGGCASAVEEMTTNIRQGACVLERLNEAIEGYGVAPIDPGASGGGGGGRWWPWVVGAVALVGVGGGLAWYAMRSSSSTTLVLGKGAR